MKFKRADILAVAVKPARRSAQRKTTPTAADVAAAHHAKAMRQMATQHREALHRRARP